MTKLLIGFLIAAALIVAVVIILQPRKNAETPPDLDQQVNQVARNLHPTKLNP